MVGKSKKQSIRNNILTIIFLMGISSVLLILISAKLFTDLAEDTEKEAMTQLIEIKALDLLTQLKDKSKEMASDLDGDTHFRQAVLNKERVTTQKILRDQFNQYYTTAGVLKLAKLTAFDQKYQLISSALNSEYAEEKIVNSCLNQINVARSKPKAERLKLLYDVCYHDGHAYYSVIAPIGGLVPTGYVQIVTDAIHKLRDLEAEFGQPIRIYRRNAQMAWQSLDWPTHDHIQDHLIASYKLINTEDIFIDVAIDHHSHESNVNQTLALVISFASLIIVPIIIFSLHILNRSTNALTQLQRSAHSLSEGNYEPIPQHSYEEIDKLVQTFNHMGGKVSGLINDLKFENERRNHIEIKLRENKKVLEEAYEKITKNNIVLDKALNDAQEATKAKSEFLANMSHEIRTPMNGVLGMLSILKKGELNNEQREFVNTAYNSGESLLILLNDILDFSKIEAKKMELESIPYDLRQNIEDVANLFAESAHTKGIELAIDFPSKIPNRLIGDPNRIKQVISNLIGNAIKFTEKGEIVIRVRKDQDRDSDKQVGIKVQVIDSGIGIPKAAQESIFNDFSQADGSTTRKYGGTGLGLSISKQLVELMDGQIGVDSDGESGSTFWFTFVQSIAQEEPIDETNFQLPKDSYKFLIVDDNKTNREILEHMIDELGVAYKSVEDGNSAVKAITEAKDNGRPFDLVFMDMMMPEMNGVQTAREIAQRSSDHKPKILLLTSMTNIDFCHDSPDIDACLHKPVRQNYLFYSIKKLLLQTPDKNSLAKEEQKEFELDRNDYRILIAEDHNINRRVVQVILEKLGLHNLVFVENGKDAVDAVKQQDFDLVLMDCQMPEMDGFEASREIRQLDASKNALTIVAMTANAMQGDKERCFEAGMDDYLPKPLNNETVEDMLEKWLKQG